VDAWFSEDVPARFEAYGWRVIRSVDGHDGEAVLAALNEARDSDGRPTLVCAKTVIGFGSPNKAGSAAVHGAALGEEEIALTRLALNWDCEPFVIPQDIYDDWSCLASGAASQSEWSTRFEAYRAAHPELAAEFERRMASKLPANWREDLDALAQSAQAEGGALETRKSSQACIGALAGRVPELFGGSADLTGSNGTRWDGADPDRYLSYGVREFGMSAITNGMALHGGFRTFSGTFLVFMEYARNAVRLAALMGVPNIFVYTHDSVAVGEDGPTHQPVEQLNNLRTTPGLSTWRPCDTVESAVAWRHALGAESQPSALIFTRQKTRIEPRDASAFTNIARGGYVLVGEQGHLDVILIATGSEVEMTVAAAETLSGQGLGVRVVSMPSTDVFLAQDPEYRESVLPAGCRARVAVEAGHPDYWFKFVGLDGKVVGIDRFGLSAPGPVAMAELGMTVENVVAAARSVTGAS
jgi:transketolase